ncbi:hypothetical protein [Chryseobacterium sp. Leaf394]|uniref:hypothetical protein n=1 Tax=Chryseobacterium sp. Leaf394 TaxID=1736361 RepID=UPI0012FE8C3E|nr:hypothetical protein [Chryseobacterium sp. Leaf394]
MSELSTKILSTVSKAMVFVSSSIGNSSKSLIKKQATTSTYFCGFSTMLMPVIFAH